MSSYNKHLTLDDHIAIQKALKEGHSFVDIAAVIGKDPSTISKEVKAHLTVKETGTRSRGFNPCAKRNRCDKTGLCKEGCLPAGMAWHYEPYCAGCSKCNDVCLDFVEERCKTLTKAPYVCNACRSIRSCALRKQVYDAKEAQQAYENTWSESRKGLDLTPEELTRLDDIVSPLVKQGQSIHQICVNNADLIMVDERTIYNYIDAGVLSVGNLDLPRKVRYKKRKAKKSVDYDNQEMIVTYQPEYMEDVKEENEGLSEDAEATAFADIVDAEAEHLAELMIQEMSGVVEENVSDRITTKQNTAIVDELLWAE